MVRREACHPCPHRPQSDADTRRRQRWLSLLAKAPAARLEALWQGLGPAPAYTVLRRPEIGLVMVQGRISGSGAAFCAGEMTATRDRHPAGKRRDRHRLCRRPRTAPGRDRGRDRRARPAPRVARHPGDPDRGAARRRSRGATSPDGSPRRRHQGRFLHRGAGGRDMNQPVTVARPGPRRSRPRRAAPVPRRARCLRPSRPHREPAGCSRRPGRAQPGDRGLSPDPGRSRHAALAGAGIRPCRRCATSCASIPARRSWPSAAEAVFAVLAHDSRHRSTASPSAPTPIPTARPPW